VSRHQPLGATYAPSATTFNVWAPHANQVETVFIGDVQRSVPMQADADGYFTCTVSDVPPGTRYVYRIDGAKDRPDPASRSQPDGVHGPSAIIAPAFDWQDAGWQPPTLRNSVLYELHVGTFTPQGTFEAIIDHLPYLRDLGITTLQIMPVAQFPGGRNWGYDGVQLYCPHSAYGGVVGLKRLVNAAPAHGLAVMLDVVYNHLGPEGNYLWDYGPYFTDRYHGGWGDAVNLDGPHSDAVRRFFIDNALHWLDEYHIDGLRLDAIHALIDTSARPFIAELAAAAHDWADRHNRRAHIIAETHHSDRRLTLSPQANGLDLDGQWLDDLHHVLHVALTGERDGYYVDYQDFDLLPKILTERFALTGQYSQVFKRRHGTSARDIPADRFIVATQTHDQVGNRMLGERLTQLTDFDGLKLAAVLLACSPYVPMLFMGEEYGETAPFLYFVSHGDPDLVEAVRRGRAEEFAAFEWAGDPPDPQSESTFMRSKLTHDLRSDGHHAQLHAFYRDLLTLRRDYPALTNPDPAATRVYHRSPARIICLERHSSGQQVRIFMNFDHDTDQTLHLPGSTAQAWRCLVTSGPDDTPSDGDGWTVTLPPKGFAIYKRTLTESNSTA